MRKTFAVTGFSTVSLQHYQSTKIVPRATDGRLLFSGLRAVVTLTLTLDRSYGIPSCISHRPLSTYQISLESEKTLWID